MKLVMFGLALVSAGARCQPNETASQLERDSEQPVIATAATKLATFAGGCFWCMEPPFDKLAAVISTTSGYMGGKVANPTYEQVSAGGTGHAEVVQVMYDPAKISYEELLEVFWVNIDPLTANRQFCDGGSQYRSAIFYHDGEQRRAAEASRLALERSARFSQPIVTELNAAAVFYAAEEYHQNYYVKNPIRYKFYRSRCGRDDRLEELWGKGTTSAPSRARDGLPAGGP